MSWILVHLLSSDEDKEDEVIQTSETVVKKEKENDEGKENEWKIIWVVSGEADDESQLN